MYESNSKSSQKPIKIFLKSSLNSSKKYSNIKEKETNYTINKIDKTIFSSEVKNNKIIHENKLKEIEQLQKELNDLENQNKLISQEISALKYQQKELNDKYDNINTKVNDENEELNELKEINDEKNREYLNLRNRQQINNTNSNDTEINNNTNTNQNNDNNNDEENRTENDRFLDIFNGLNFLLNISRLRRTNEDDGNDNITNHDGEENNDEGPAMTNQQLQALPSSIYPRNNNNNEKCIICQFDFCYKDTVTKLRCNHTFHRNCLINRLSARQSSKCPNCKASII